MKGKGEGGSFFSFRERRNSRPVPPSKPSLKIAIPTSRSRRGVDGRGESVSSPDRREETPWTVGGGSRRTVAKASVDDGNARRKWRKSDAKESVRGGAGAMVDGGEDQEMRSVAKRAGGSGSGGGSRGRGVRSQERGRQAAENSRDADG